jgi:DNA-binding LacI/PurR family transcriptional regulator
VTLHVVAAAAVDQDGPVSERVTLQTIADHLGVSRTTVSNAYNRPGQLGAELRERILAAAAELGYSGPDAAARMLRTGRMGAIGLLFTEDLRFVFNDPDTMGFLQGVAETSALAGTGLTLVPAPPGADVAQTAVLSSAVDGHLVFSVADGHPAFEAVLAGGQPVVVVDEPDLGDVTSFVGIDDRAGARMAADHLIGLGHTHLAVLLGRLTTDVRIGRVDQARHGEATVRIARERIAGYRDAMTSGGLDPASLVLWEAGGNDPDAARRAALDLLAACPDVTGLLCFSDQIAIGACQAGRRRGVRIPEDLSVVGFDDVPRASTWEPALTTVRQPLVDKGRLAAELLLELIGGAPKRRVELPIELITRESTGPVPTTGSPR